MRLFETQRFYLNAAILLDKRDILRKADFIFYIVLQEIADYG
ncbi:hypothetical protein MTBBW1_410054 [Desulfamplus magnetovallimortis]|uniref:Uncharacterized protein n=1 Tax=Desulfamplus magnetovallimortis TaxID=1246637 RepID=A0A1W1HGU6_9BACT|nr:hypothetical protein MTBBW1_410054 [Desulfamplus magnetovallimortis]